MTIRWTSEPVPHPEDFEPPELLLLDEDDPILVYIGQLQVELRTFRECISVALDLLAQTAKERDRALWQLRRYQPLIPDHR